MDRGRPQAHLGLVSVRGWGGEGAGVGARRGPAAIAAVARAPARGGRKGGKARRGEVLRAPRKLLTHVVRGRREAAAATAARKDGGSGVGRREEAGKRLNRGKTARPGWRRRDARP
jgi:hypothetical protein